ncbi:GDP-mannose 4,6-dehydratase [Chloroflexota bacterium]
MSLASRISLGSVCDYRQAADYLKKALVFGITGQDGSYLAKLLLRKGYQVYGTHRNPAFPDFWRLRYLGIQDEVSLLPLEVFNKESLAKAVNLSQPDEIYNLASQSTVKASFDDPTTSDEVTGSRVTMILEAIRRIDPRIRFFQASSREVFGRHGQGRRNESSHIRPESPYAAAKAYAGWLVNIYREKHGIFACNGILFNHESPLRGLEFVTRKISDAVARISLGMADSLELGSLDVRRDWGYAGDYVEAMWLMLQDQSPDDMVIATGETHTVREFLRKAFGLVGLDWKRHVVSSLSEDTGGKGGAISGDISRIKSRLGWQPETGFDQLIEMMVKEDVARWQRWLQGEIFPWDIDPGPVPCSSRTP